MPLINIQSARIMLSCAIIVLICSMGAVSLAKADHLTVAFSFAKPPYVFAEKLEDTYDTRGIELEIMTKALALMGHSFKPLYTTYDRLNGELESGNVDAAATVRPELDGIFYSKEFVYFHNFAITRKNTPPIKAIGDLVGRSLVAWQGATKDLGPAFAAASKQTSVYKEIPDQQRQVKLFLKKRVNTIVIDGSIFRFWARELGENPKDFTYNSLFGGKTSFVVGFRSKKLRDDFDAGLAKLHATGEYKDIFRRFIGG